MISIGFNPNRVLPEFYEFCTSPIEVTEKKNSGKASLICTFVNAGDREFIRLLKEHDPLLRYGRNQCSTDGIIIESDVRDRKKAKLYIIELKTSMDVTTWNHVKDQFRGATLRGLAMASSMGFCEIEGISYYTAYVEAEELLKTAKDLETKERLEGIIARKVQVGVKKKEVEEWQKSTIRPFSEQPAHFPHFHVQMSRETDSNVGAVTIHN